MFEIITICLWVVAGIMIGVMYKGQDIPRSIFWITYAILMFELIFNVLEMFL